MNDEAKRKWNRRKPGEKTTRKSRDAIVKKMRCGWIEYQTS